MKTEKKVITIKLFQEFNNIAEIFKYIGLSISEGYTMGGDEDIGYKWEIRELR